MLVSVDFKNCGRTLKDHARIDRVEGQYLWSATQVYYLLAMHCETERYRNQTVFNELNGKNDYGRFNEICFHMFDEGSSSTIEYNVDEIAKTAFKHNFQS